jgi:hypothetical protein
MWHLDSNMSLVESRDIEAEGCSKQNNIVSLKFVLVRLTVGRFFTFRVFSILSLIVDTPKTLKYEVQETESTPFQQCL